MGFTERTFIFIFLFIICCSFITADAPFVDNKGDIGLRIDVPTHPKIIKQTGFERNFYYEFSKASPSEWEITVCHKNYDKNKNDKKLNDYKPKKLDKTSKLQKKEEKQLDLKKNKCDSFITTENPTELLKLGTETTEIIFDDDNLTLKISPETKPCSYLKCVSEISLHNRGDNPVFLNSSDVMASVANAEYWLMTEREFELIDDNGSNYIETQLVNADQGFPITIAPMQTRVYYLHSVQENENTVYKYDVALRYLNEIHLIDPYFITTNTSFNDNSSYDRTYLNESGFVQLNVSYSHGNYTQIFDMGLNSSGTFSSFAHNSTAYNRSLPNNQGIEPYPNGVNMTGNVLLSHFEDSANPVSDYSGLGNDGSYNGVLWQQSGKFNYSLGFDGNDDTVIINDTPELNFGNNTDFSVTFWVKRQTFGVTDVILDKRAAISTGWGLWFRPDEALQIRLNIESYISSPLTVTDTNWHHIAIVVDRDSAITFYIDGQSDVSASTTNDQNVTTSSDIYLARVSYADVLHYDGLLDEFAIFNRTLSGQEVQDMYLRGVLALNLWGRSCDDAFCVGEAYEKINASGALNVPNNRYFQYQARFFNNNSGATPELWEVSLEYTDNCTTNWVPVYGPCLINDTRIIVSYNDTNNCNTSSNKPTFNGSVSCNYCSYNAVFSAWSVWSDIAQDCGNRSRMTWDANWSTCAAVTGLPTDFYMNDNQTYQGNYTQNDTRVCTQLGLFTPLCNETYPQGTYGQALQNTYCFGGIKMISVMMGFFILIAFLMSGGFANYKLHHMKKEKLTFWLSFICFGLAAIQITMVAFTMYAGQTNTDITGILDVNFFAVLVITLSLIMITLWKLMFAMMDTNDQEEETKKL